MASQMAVLQAAGQVAALQNQAQEVMEANQKVDPADTKPWYVGCCSGDTDGEQLDIDEMTKQPIRIMLAKLTLRMNVYSGQNMTQVPTYLEIACTDIKTEHKQHSFPDQPASNQPAWEYTFELPLTFKGGQTIDVEVTVWERHWARSELDRRLGHFTVTVLPSPTEWPVIVNRKLLSGVPADIYGRRPASEVRYAYELILGHAKDKPLQTSDLLQLAMMGEAGLMETKYSIQPSVHRLELHNQPPGEELSYQVELAIVKRRLLANSKRREAVGGCRKMEQIRAKSTDRGRVEEQICATSSDRGGPDEELWSLKVQQSQLAGYMLEVLVKIRQPDNEIAVEMGEETNQTGISLGISDNHSNASMSTTQGDTPRRHRHHRQEMILAQWEETLLNLVGYIAEEGTKTRLRAQLTKPSNGTVMGELELGLDIWDLEEHKPTPTEGYQKRLRAGRRQKQDNHPTNFYFILWLDRFEPPAGQEPNPFVRVTMGGSYNDTLTASECTPNSIRPNTHRVKFEPIGIFATAGSPWVRLEVYNKVVTSLSEVDHFVGQVLLRDLVAKETYWRHIFAGSPAGKYTQVSTLMGKGIKQASTFRCSLGVWMQSHPSIPDLFHERVFGQEYKKFFITVRLYQGLYLDRFKNKDIKVVVTCGNAPRDSGDEFSSKALLVFSGRVDKHGALRFKAKQKQALEVAYVEKTLTAPIELPSRVFHAYVDILEEREDETTTPPTVFGRLRLQRKGHADHTLEPAWKRLRTDSSVVDVPESLHEDLNAGALLGWAVAYPPRTDSSPSHPQTPRSTEPTAAAVNSDAGTNSSAPQAEKDGLQVEEHDGQVRAVCCVARPEPARDKNPPGVSWKPVEKGDGPTIMYCHVDLIAFRSLFPADWGEVDVHLELQVCNQAPKILRSGIQKSPNPTLNQRHEISVPAYTLQDLPPPPIILTAKRTIQGEGLRPVESVICRVLVKTMPLDMTPEPGAGSGGDSPSRLSSKRRVAGRQGAEGVLDLNKAHTARWICLEGKYKQRFTPGDSGRGPEFWEGRPRLLIAAGFSERQNGAKKQASQASPCHKGGESASAAGFSQQQEPPLIETPTTKRVEIDLSLLGVRDLQDASGNPIADTGTYTLEITPWWDASKKHCKLDLNGHGQVHEFPNPNFRSSNPSFDDKPIEDSVLEMYSEMRGLTDKLVQKGEATPIKLSADAEEGSRFIEVFTPDDVEIGMVITIQEEQDCADQSSIVEETNVKKRVTKSVTRVITSRQGLQVGLNKKLDCDFSSGANVFTVELRDRSAFMGQRLHLPPCECPIIPYLQQDDDDSEKAQTIVLLPDIVFRLLHLPALALGSPACKGTAVVPLPLETLDPDDLDPGPWAESCAKRHEEAKADPERGKLTAPFEDVIDENILDPVVDMFVDVFASKDGYLKFDRDMRLGRCLRSQRLFGIWDSDPSGQGSWTQKDREKELKSMTEQHFNIVDTICTDRTKLHVPYDNKFMPTFFNATWTGDVHKAQWGWEPCPLKGRLSAEAQEGARELEVHVDQDVLRSFLVEGGAVPELNKEPAKLQDVVAHGMKIALAECETRNIEKVEGNKVTLHAKLEKTYTKDDEVAFLIRNPRHKAPIEPQDVFKGPLDDMHMNFEYINRAPMNEVKASLGQLGWRSATRLAAPELVDDARWRGEDAAQLKKCNSQTFIRPVGHVVKPASRESTILARLRMGVPLSRREKYLADPAQPLPAGASSFALRSRVRTVHPQASSSPEKMLVKMEDRTRNFLVVKCNKPAVVVWSPPEEQYEFVEAGANLLVLELLDGSEQRVVVTVPSTDVRYLEETTWYVRKTLLSGFNDLRRRMLESVKEEADTGHARPIHEEGDDDQFDDEDEEYMESPAHLVDDDSPHMFQHGSLAKAMRRKLKLEKQKMRGMTCGDGFGQAVKVREWAFVLRLWKRGLTSYHRRATCNYYRALLDYFPEYSTQAGLQWRLMLERGKEADDPPAPAKRLPDKEEDLRRMKHLVHKRTLNLRRELVAVGHDGLTGCIKGHVRVRNIINSDAPQEEDDDWFRLEGHKHPTDMFGHRKVFDRLDGAKAHALSMGFAGFTRERAEGAADVSDEPKAKYCFHITVDKSEHKKAIPSPRHTLFWQRPSQQMSNRISSPLFVNGMASLSNSPFGNGMASLGLALAPTSRQVHASCPVSNMWLVSNIRVVISVLSVHSMPPADYDVQPYITVEVPGLPKKTEEVEVLRAGDTNLEIYWQTDFEMSLPGSNTLTIKLWQKNFIGGALLQTSLLQTSDSQIGEVTVDLEDRWLSLLQREFRINTRYNMLHTFVSPIVDTSMPVPDLLRDKGFDMASKRIVSPKAEPSKVSKVIKRRRAPLRQAPIEYVPLLYKQQGCLPEERGMLRYCAEIMHADEIYRPMMLKRPKKKLHVRIYITDVQDIGVFRDSGERNDVYVVGAFHLRDSHGVDQPVEERMTDVHKFAWKKATFNYTWNFVVEAPVGAASLKLTLFDADRFSSDSQIYDTVDLALDLMIQTAFKMWARNTARVDNPSGADDGDEMKGEEMPTIAEKVVFDTWPADYPEHAKFNDGCFGYFVRKCCMHCCKRRNIEVPLPPAATMRVSITIRPVDDDFSIDNAYREGEEPDDRLNQRSALSNPRGTAVTMIGHSNTRLCKKVAICVCCVVFVGLVLAFAIGFLHLVDLALVFDRWKPNNETQAKDEK